MKWETYKDELRLIHQQNNVEHDLYNIIANVIRENDNNSKISLRDISNRRRTNPETAKEKTFWGIGGFPDFVVLNRDFKASNPQKDKIHGAVEIKFIGAELEKSEQLKGHILWFNKVLYTNGLIWEFYEHIPESKEEQDKINSIQKHTYLWREKKKYRFRENEEEFLNYVEPIKPQKRFVIGKIESNSLEWDHSEWNSLIKHLKTYEWVN